MQRVQRRVLAEDRALGHEVPDVAAPVLDLHVAQLGVLADDQLDHRRGERLHVLRRRAEGIGDERLGALFDARPGCARRPAAPGSRNQAERPERRLDRDALRHVEERASLPEGGVQRLELAQRRLHRLGHEVALDQLRVLAEGRGEIGEDHALGGDLRIERRQDRRASRCTMTPALGPSAICAAASSTPASSSACSGAMPAIVDAGRRAQAVELQTAQVGAPPLLVGPLRHRQRFIQLPGPQSRIAAGAGFDARPRDGFDTLPREPGLLGCTCHAGR